MKRLAAGLAATSMVLAGLATAQGAAAHSIRAAAPAPVRSGYTPPKIRWGRCALRYLRRHRARCGFLVVPLDYSHPHGPTIKLAVSRIRHTAKRYQGVMLVNPGGPGASGLGLATLGDYVPGRSAKTYDWIGFDPRGAGSSRPALSCIGRYFHFDRPPYVPRSRDLKAIWLARSKHYADACAHAKASELLGHLRTIDTVRDMDTLRKALGRKRINYYGFSYGTYLGQVYATVHPHRVRRFVLDSNVDPRRVWYQANLNQDVAFDRNIGIYFRWIARHSRVYHLGRRGKAIERRYHRELRRLARRPAGGRIGPAELTDIFLDAGYAVFDWEIIARAYARWMHHGRPGGLIRIYRALTPIGPGADKDYANYLATSCTDAGWPRWSKQVRDTRRINRRHPFFAWGNTWYNAPCLFWHAPSGHPVRVSGARVRAPVLLFDETKDAATPYQGSLEVRSLFPTARLIAGVGGTTHGASLNGVACVDNTIARYLAHGTVPKRLPGRRADKRCPALSPPSPTAHRRAARLARCATPSCSIRQSPISTTARSARFRAWLPSTSD